LNRPGTLPPTQLHREAWLHSAASLLKYCRDRHWAGADPFDGLNSRFFQALPLLKNHRWPRLVLIQGIKRCPINLRPLLAVPPGINPKGIALFLACSIRLQRAGLMTEADSRTLASQLLELRSTGWKNSCWGYHFDWQTRTYLVPRYYPNIICTTFAADALLDAYDALGDPAWLQAATEAGRFLLEDLLRYPEGDTFCFSYTPLKPSRVHNASLLGAALLARLYPLTGIEEFRHAALAATRYGIAHQQPDGSWIYGEDPHQEWIDSFHTGYNLIALRSVARHLRDEAADRSLHHGFEYYRKAFFQPDGVVKYYHDRVHPIDGHAIAHALLTLAEFRDLHPANLEMADRVLAWANTHFRAADGSYYYQRTPSYTNRISYMRWTQAWMLRGISELITSTE